MKRFYYESDGGPGGKTHYVVDRYADPMGDSRRTDVESRRDGLRLARQYNESSPWPVWDTIQYRRDEGLLPESIEEKIHDAAVGRAGELDKYRIPQNSDDHLALVALSIAREIIESIVYSDEHFMECAEWIGSGDTVGGCWSRNTQIEKMAKELALEMVCFTGDEP